MGGLRGENYLCIIKKIHWETMNIGLLIWKEGFRDRAKKTD